MVLEWLKKPEKQRIDKWCEKLCEKWKVSQSTVYRRVRAYVKENAWGLVPEKWKRGRKSSVSKEVQELIELYRQEFL